MRVKWIIRSFSVLAFAALVSGPAEATNEACYYRMSVLIEGVCIACSGGAHCTCRPSNIKACNTELDQPTSG